MVSTATPEANAKQCPFCTRVADPAQTDCAHCGNPTVFPDPSLMTLTFSAFPTLDRDLIERVRKVVREIEPKKLRIDFAGVQLPSPAVYASLMLLVKDVKKLGNTIAVRNVDPKIHDMFVITRVDGLIETEPPV